MTICLAASSVVVASSAHSQANAEDTQNPPAITLEGFLPNGGAINASRAEASIPASMDYSAFGLPEPVVPTPDRPFYFVQLDKAVADAYFHEMVIVREEVTNPAVNDFGLREMIDANRDRLVVVNFIDEQSSQSARQSDLLVNALNYLAPRSGNKELMLIDVVARDVAGNKPYGASYVGMYEENTLGPDGSPKEELTLPYGLILGEELVSGHGNRLWDFSIANNAKNEIDIRENSKSIAVILSGFVEAYNRRQPETVIDLNQLK